MLRVYYTELTEPFREDCPFPLSEYRRQKLSKVKAPSLRRQMIAAEWLLIKAVRDYAPQTTLPLEITCAERGKPRFRELPLCFSLSHSGPFVACAIADHEIGLDIQEHVKNKAFLAERFFSAEEKRFLQEQRDQDRAFTALWALKESYLKATGEGLSRALDGFSVDPECLTLRENREVSFWRFSDARFELALCALDGYSPNPEFIISTELRPD